MRFAITLILPAMLAAMPATAQGVFNMGGLTQTLTIPTDQTEARQARDTGAYRLMLRPRPRAAPVPRINRAAFAYRRDPAITARVQRAFVARFGDPGIRAQVARNMAGSTAKIVGALRPVGMEYTNLADAQATYLVTAWQATHRQYKDNPAHFRAVSRQMAGGNERAGLAKLSNAAKQELAETLLYDAMFMGGLFDDAKTNPTLQRRLAALASNGSQAFFGIDVAGLKMTPAGLAR